jgi:hypothetical protein
MTTVDVAKVDLEQSKDQKPRGGDQSQECNKESLAFIVASQITIRAIQEIQERSCRG